MGLKLYGVGASRWVRPYWTLKELDVEFEPVVVRLSKGEGKNPEYLNLQPFGKVPALVDGDITLYESAAICTYLGDKFIEKNLIPMGRTRDRALHDQWVCFVISDLEQPLWRIARHTFLYPESQRSPADIALAKTDFLSLAAVVETKIEDYLVGGKFSVADILMSYTLHWASRYKLLDEMPKLSAYVKTHTSRPAFPAKLYESSI